MSVTKSKVQFHKYSVGKKYKSFGFSECWNTFIFWDLKKRMYTINWETTVQDGAVMLDEEDAGHSEEASQ